VGDVKLLALAFLKKYGQGRIAGIEDAAMAALEAYPWPGKVRELENVLERAGALAEEKTIPRQDLPDNVLVPVAAAPGPLSSGPDLSGPDAGAELPLKDAKARWMEVLDGTSLPDTLAR